MKILQDGGNAVDAAVATMAMIALQEPNSTGLGAEMFAIIWDAKTKKLYQISANGPSPKNYTPEVFKMNVNSSGNPYLPRFVPPYGTPGTTGIFSAMVPGSVDGWDKMLKRFGTMTFKEVLEPARKSAFEGFPVHEVLASSFRGSRSNLCSKTRDPDTPDVFCQGGSEQGGNVPGLYSIFRNPDLGHAFEVLQKKGRDAFYKGEIAAAIVKKANSLGVILPSGMKQFWTMDDLKHYQAKWVEPLTTSYHGYDICETPPPSQGWAALEMLNILEQCAETKPFDLAELGRENALFTHIEVEAKKLAYSDLLGYNADPRFYPELYDLISSYFNNKEWVRNNLCSKLDLTKATPATLDGNLPDGTIYGASADRWGNMVSFVYSVYTSWGSGVTIPGYGFQLQPDRDGAAVWYPCPMITRSGMLVRRSRERRCLARRQPDAGNPPGGQGADGEHLPVTLRGVARDGGDRGGRGVVDRPLPQRAHPGDAVPDRRGVSRCAGNRGRDPGGVSTEPGRPRLPGCPGGAGAALGDPRRHRHLARRPAGVRRGRTGLTPSAGDCYIVL